MQLPCRLVLVALALLASPNAESAVTVEGTAVTLESKTIPNISQLEVFAISDQGIILAGPASIKGSTYTLIIDDTLLRRLRIVSVALRYRAPGRESVTLNNVLGLTNQQIDVVLPEAKIYQQKILYPIPCCPTGPQVQHWQPQYSFPRMHCYVAQRVPLDARIFALPLKRSDREGHRAIVVPKWLPF